MTLWDVVTDVALLGALMLIGQFLRAKVKLFQSLLLPASLIGGFIGLALGPSGMNVLPFSKSLSGYAGILIAVVFGCTPIGDKPLSKKELKGVGGFFYQNTGILILQYAFGMALSLFVLNKFWPELHNSFGLVLATGFYGGHGTAAAVGSAFKDLGYAEFFDLGNASATVGMVVGILFGMALINWGTRKGYTNYVTSPKELPSDMRTGLIPPEQQKTSTKGTINNMSLDSLAFHVGIAIFVTFLAKKLSEVIAKAVPGLSIPVFVLALAVGYVAQFFLRATKSDKYVDRATLQRISGTSTDFLVCSAVASLKLSTIATYAGPLIITFILGIVLNIVWFLGVSKYSSEKDWFERGIMNYGRSNGVVATGVLLNRVVDPDAKSRGLEDTGITDLLNRPVAIALQVLPPAICMGTLSSVYAMTGVMWLGFVVLTVIALALKWWTPGKMQGDQKK